MRLSLSRGAQPPAVHAEEGAQVDAYDVAGDGHEDPHPAVQAGRGDAAEEGADVAAIGQPGTVTQHQPAQNRRQERPDTQHVVHRPRPGAPGQGRHGRRRRQEEGDVDFHYKVILGSHNQQLINLICGQLYHLVRMYRCQFGMHSPRATRAFTEHSNIIQAISDRDGELAELLMRRHIAASRKNIENKIALQKATQQSEET